MWRMKNVLLLKLLLTATIVNSQPIVQPVSSGDYWRIDEFQNRLPELAVKTTFPATINFTNGYAGINNFYVNKLIGQNEIVWDLGSVRNATNFVIEWSRDLRTFERAGVVNLDRVEGNRFVYRHQLNEKNLVYYRIGIVTGARTIAYTPAVQVLDEEYSIKVFPTLIKGSTFYIETGQPFEKMQVVNSAGQSVYEKGINGQTGTITIGLPSLATGAYFVRLLSANRPQHVERIVVQ
ncbi:MAG: T9SS type A sorting domain-containing protein [Chitinophagaceae bacterium]|nr:MAG: T9SS type A sorting domain-containing protein [Chitinophagaceae bacterium]